MNASVRRRSKPTFPFIDTGRMQIVNALCSKNASFVHERQPYKLNVLSTDYEAAQPLYYVGIEMGGEPADLYIEQKIAKEMVGELFPLDKIDIIPADLLMIAVNGAMEKLIQKANKTFSSEFEITHFRKSSFNVDDDDVVGFMLNQGRKPLGKLFLCDPSEKLTDLLIDNFSRKRSVRNLMDKQPLLDVRFVLSEITLEIHDLKQLEVNDVVVTQQSSNDDAISGTVVVNEQFGGKITMLDSSASLEDRLENLKKLSKKTTGIELNVKDNKMPPQAAAAPMADNSNVQNVTEAPLIADENSPELAAQPEATIESLNSIFDENALEVSVSFELPRQFLSYDELKKVDKGYVFEIAKPKEAVISLYVSNRCIGKGEIVTVGNKLGVRLLEMADGSH